jgi:CheY-like chemotaxis protein
MDILIVDDNALNARALQRVLKVRHHVRVATTSSAALNEVKARRPDVIICDYELGEETCAGFLRIVSSHHPGVRRLLYSASRPELWQELVDQHLIDAAIAKPASTQQIVDALDK